MMKANMPAGYFTIKWKPIIKKTALLTFLLVFLCYAASNRVLAIGGGLDAGFGDGGKATLAILEVHDEAQAVAIQGDGKIVVAGYATTAALRFNHSVTEFALARFNRDGSVDTSFGQGGKVRTSFADHLDQALAVAIQNDGKIVAAGFAVEPSFNARSALAIARYNSDGTLDASFGSNGKFTSGFTHFGTAIHDIAIQNDGKIVGVGNEGSSLALIRVHANGTLDSSFGVGGKALGKFSGGSAEAEALELQPDGKILVAGTDSFIDFALARFNTDGSPDNGFGVAGRVVTKFDGFSDATAIALQSDNKIVVGGSGPVNGGAGFALARYNSDGSLDLSFGSQGKLTSDLFLNGAIFDLAIQTNGKIIAVGRVSSLPLVNLSFALARYNSDGSVDASYGSEGRILTNFFGPRDSLALAVALQPDGKAVVVGMALDLALHTVFAIARYGSTIPKITSVSISGKNLRITGMDFDPGASILLNGEKQKSRNDDLSPNSILIAKKAAKRIKAGKTVTLQVMNSDGTLSDEFSFTR